MKHSEYYFGKEEYTKYGDMVRSALSGHTVSKRVDRAEVKGGLKYEAIQLGIDVFDLLACLEGMCYNGTAAEINDSTYRVF